MNTLEEGGSFALRGRQPIAGHQHIARDLTGCAALGHDGLAGRSKLCPLRIRKWNHVGPLKLAMINTRRHAGTLRRQRIIVKKADNASGMYTLPALNLTVLRGAGAEPRQRCAAGAENDLHDTVEPIPPATDASIIERRIGGLPLSPSRHDMPKREAADLSGRPLKHEDRREGARYAFDHKMDQRRLAAACGRCTTNVRAAAPSPASKNKNESRAMPTRGYRKGQSDRKEPAPCFVRTRVTTRMFVRLDHEAAARNLTYSRLLYEILKAHQAGQRLAVPQARAVPHALLRQLSGALNNLNQLTRQVNTGVVPVTASELRQVMDALERLARAYAT